MQSVHKILSLLSTSTASILTGIHIHMQWIYETSLFEEALIHKCHVYCCRIASFIWTQTQPETQLNKDNPNNLNQDMKTHPESNRDRKQQKNEPHFCVKRVSRLTWAFYLYWRSRCSCIPPLRLCQWTHASINTRFACKSVWKLPLSFNASGDAELRCRAVMNVTWSRWVDARAVMEARSRDR